ncbi:MAG: 2-oxoacid:acceptor oxidoreductase family protein [Candidatus Heimdallarchaeota archaeon]|nr:2-oxoacid:acceptor oxidoreductase family protein [Candidatus Heimdallarchaeota archaeon]
MGTVLAKAATYDGKYVVSIPKYGAERRGAPVQTSVKIDDKPIRRHAQIERPTDVVALDFTLVPRFFDGDIFDGEGSLTLNGFEVPDSYKIYNPAKFGLCNVQQITEDVGLVRAGSYMVAIPMLGSFLATSGILTMESLHKAIDDVFGKSEYLEANHKAVDLTYEGTKLINLQEIN